MAIFHFPAPAGQHKKESEKNRPALQHRSYVRSALGAGTILLLSFLLTIHLVPNRVYLQVGDISDQDIKAHRTVHTYVDAVGTQKKRQEAMASVGRQYRDVPNAEAEAVDMSVNVLATLQRAREDISLGTLADKKRFVRQNLRLQLSEDGLSSLLTCDSRTFGQIKSYSKQLIMRLMSREIRDDGDEVETARGEFARRMLNYLGNPKYSAAADEIGNAYITSNRVYDPSLTDKMRQHKAAAVSTQHGQIIQGETIISRGERVTPEHIAKFAALDLQNPQVDYVSILCITLLIACVATFVIIYISRFHPAIYSSDKLLMLLSLIIITNVLGLKLGGMMLGLKLSGLQFGYFAMSWIATAGMLTAVLLDPQLALVVVSLLSCTAGFALDHELRWSLSAFISSLVAIYAVSDIRHRSDLVRAGAAVCAANMSMVWLIGRISGDESGELLTGTTWAIAGGLASITLFALGTALLEKPFGITTHNRLIELSDTNNPILKRLLMEAPGTYSHSIFVGNVASMAADVIGADALLVRVASYYHDLGKIRRPHFFVENQYVENAHDGLNPSLSALVIRSHIKDGLDIAKEYKLPPLICRLMSEHHGTSLVRYFYSQAVVAANGSTALEQQFRYDGRKPQSRESALLMLADSVEAASRTLSKPTPGQIEDLVDKIISDKLSDGQLDESELTFKDISRIRDSFIRTLTSMMHARIEYPELPTEAKRTFGNGSAGKEQSAGDPGHEGVDGSRQEVAAR